MRASDIFSMAGNATWLVQPPRYHADAGGDPSIPLRAIARLGDSAGNLELYGLVQP